MYVIILLQEPVPHYLHVLIYVRLWCYDVQISEMAHNYTGLQQLVQLLQAVGTAGSTTVLAEPFQLSRLVPEFSNLYLTYNGSLTTPPCSETVSWVIRKEPLTVSRQQVCLTSVAMWEGCRSSISIVSGWPRFDSWQGQDSGAHPASYPMGTGGSFPWGGEAARTWNWPLTSIQHHG
jgi:hypothetical protein